MRREKSVRIAIQRTSGPFIHTAERARMQKKRLLCARGRSALKSRNSLPSFKISIIQKRAVVEGGFDLSESLEGELVASSPIVLLRFCAKKGAARRYREIENMRMRVDSGVSVARRVLGLGVLDLKFALAIEYRRQREEAFRISIYISAAREALER